MLPSRIRIPPPTNPTPEDIFSSSLSTIFPDANVNSHGDPGGSLIYASPSYGDIHLRVPEHPEKEEGRQLFAHYLWNAAGVVAEEIERAATERRGGWWDVREETILELGAGSCMKATFRLCASFCVADFAQITGTALPSLIAARAGARQIYITDHPSSPALTSGSIRENVRQNIQIVATQSTSDDNGAQKDPAGQSHTPSLTTTPEANAKSRTEIHILPHIWGSGLSSSSSSLTHSFTKLLVADCLWMPSQHANLVRTIKHFLHPLPSSPTSKSRTTNTASSPSRTPQASLPCALIVAGFHTGRAIVANFFRTATSLSTPFSSSSPISTSPSSTPCTNSPPTADGEIEEQGRKAQDTLRIEQIYEVDVNDGTKREFAEERPREGKEEARRWCVIAVLTLRKGVAVAVGEEEGGEDGNTRRDGDGEPEEDYGERGASEGIGGAGFGVVDGSRDPDSLERVGTDREGGDRSEDAHGPINATLVIDEVGWV